MDFLLAAQSSLVIGFSTTGLVLCCWQHIMYLYFWEVVIAGSILYDISNTIQEYHKEEGLSAVSDDDDKSYSSSTSSSSSSDDASNDINHMKNKDIIGQNHHDLTSSSDGEVVELNMCNEHEIQQVMVHTGNW